MSVIKSKNYLLEFSDMGKPVSFKYLPLKKELLDLNRTSMGFYMVIDGNKIVPFTSIGITADNKLIARNYNSTQEVVFSISNRFTKHLAFKIEQVKGIPVANNITLHFGLNTTGNVKVMDIDYMTEVQNADNALKVNWFYTWHRTETDPLGGFAIYYKKNDDDEDDTIIHIWAEEKLAHPNWTSSDKNIGTQEVTPTPLLQSKSVGVIKERTGSDSNVPEEWTYQRAKQWVKYWQKTFADRSQLEITPNNLEELYEITKYAERSGIKCIYFFTSVWRNNEFWPTHEVNWNIRRDIFPNGEKDVREYSDYLKKRGMRLNFHYVSGGIGFYDPIYVGSKPDKRLANWGKGKLAEPVICDDNTIKFKPDYGVELPYRGVLSSSCKPPALWDFFNFDQVLIGDEIIKVGSFEDTNKDTWVFKNCTRGMYDTKSAGHEAGSQVVGLISTYGVNFIPDNDSTLLDEITAGYAGMLNRCNIMHTEFDGAEIHAYSGGWGYRKFATKVYSIVDHPYTTHDSGGSVPPCNIEYRLNSTEKMVCIKILHSKRFHPAFMELDTSGRPVVNMLDNNFSLSFGYEGGALGLQKPEPTFGINLDTLKRCGITDKLMGLCRDWQKAIKMMTEKQKELIGKTFMRLGGTMRSQFPCSEIVHVLEKDRKGMRILPTFVMRRKKNDIQWNLGDEFGVISPKQYLQQGENIKLNNIYLKQEPGFVIRVLWAFDYNRQTVDSKELEKRIVDTAPILEIVCDDNIEENPRFENPDNILLQPAVNEINNSSDTVLVERKDGIELSISYPLNEEKWEFVNLPGWRRRVDMVNHRGVGMEITGDGSNSIFIIQIPGREYIVPIDFKGKRYIEIPNGEVSWHDSRWGYRLNIKGIRYAEVNRFKMGFGYIPPKTKSKIIVSGIKALQEIPAELNNPVIHAGKGTIEIQGTIHSSEYVEYNSGTDFVTIYDRNYNKINKFKIIKKNFIVPNGFTNFRIDADKSKYLPWMEVKFLTKGNPLVLK